MRHMENIFTARQIQSLSERLLELKPFYVESAAADIFSWKELENLLNFRPFLNIHRFRPTMNISASWPHIAWLTDKDCYPIELVDNLIRDSHFHITECSRVNEKLNAICFHLEKILRLPTDAHIYVDLREYPGEGFGIHYDFSHNLIVQIEGQTEVTVWDIKNENGTVSPTHIESDPMIFKVMNPGDIIFIPALYYHKACSLTKRMSISFPSWTIGNISNDSFDSRHWISLDKILPMV